MATSNKQNSKESWYTRHPELFGITLIIAALTLLASLVTFQNALPQSNLLGLFGYGSAFLCLKLFGIGSFPLLLTVFWLGTRLLLSHKYTLKQLIALATTVASFCLLAVLAADVFPFLEVIFANLFAFTRDEAFRLGGIPTYFLYKELPQVNLERIFNFTGTLFISLAMLSLSLCYIFEKELIDLIQLCKDKISEIVKRRQERALSQKNETKFREGSQAVADDEKPASEKRTFHGLKVPSLLSRIPELTPTFTGLPESLAQSLKKDAKKETLSRTALDIEAPEDAGKTLDAFLQKKQPMRSAIKRPVSSNASYSLPSIDLLNPPKKSDNSLLKKEMKQKADLLEETLMSFGIEAKVGQIHSGPTITSFEVHPAVGVKVGRIRTLEHDIALNLEAKSIRIIAPIPGKAAVGIEVPNKQPQEVSFKELLSAYQEKEPFRIPMLLGKTVNGDFVFADLTKMPHCIIAGATGSGKSVCINSIVMSILMTASPDEIRLLMVDPKKVELTPYSELPHMLAPVITDPKTACIALNWLVKEMEKRYDLLKLTGQRNIEAFNNRKKTAPDAPQPENTQQIEIPEKLPYYVAIIDELADLMMVASSDIETPIARIAQMARAVGIHLILATQRPSREVITGLIKANFPARISFKVASRVNSQIVLDEVGAETLLGNGDMLFLPPGSSQLVRAQGVFVRDEEIYRAIEHISKHSPPQYIINSFDRLPADFGLQDSADSEPTDALFEDAKTTVLTTGNASTTFLQRKLKIGYARAASLMDELEKKGVVGPQEGAKPRQIFFPKAANKVMAFEESGLESREESESEVEFDS